MASVTDPLILPEDIIFSPVEELSEEMRRRMGSIQGDVAVSRPRSRTPSKVVSSHAADLLRLFKEPKTIAEAVIEYCREHSAEPNNVLREAFAVVQDFVNDQFLLPEASSVKDAIKAALEPGDRVGDFTLVRRVQTLVDTEIYQARASDGKVAAIKMTREQAGPTAAAMLAHEARILKTLGGEFSPDLLDIDVFEDRLAYMAITWIEGTSVNAVAAQLRALGEVGWEELFKVCVAVLEIYGKLHDKGVVHGDIHPGNILLDARDRVWLIDFGLADQLDDEARSKTPRRGGVAFFFEPEYAEAVRRKSASPPIIPASEQYSLAALMYHLITGVYTHDFSLERETMLRQIAEEPPLPFSQQSVKRMPGVESVLTKALSKVPQDRFASVAEFAGALQEAVSADAKRAKPRQSSTHMDGCARFLKGVIERCGWESDLLESGLPRPPKASLNYGAAGVGWMFYRLGRLQNDAALLALADVWIDRAWEEASKGEAFYNSEIDITEATVGRISPYHTLSGVHVMNALIADSRCDVFTRDRSLRGFSETAKEKCENLDVTLGRSGIVLIGALLSRTIGDMKLMEETGVLSLGRESLDTVWHQLDSYAPIAEAEEVEYLGTAHGWAGFLYAALSWSLATGDPVKGGVERRLHELAERVELFGRGVRWPWRRDGHGWSYMPGWCNGTAGYVFLWTMAHRVTGEGRWLSLAEKAAWNCWEDPAQPASLCCGLTGRAYALLNWYKLSQERVWVPRARQLAINARRNLPEELRHSEAEGFENSLYKGEVGLATLLADLEQPAIAAMPLFEAESWS